MPCSKHRCASYHDTNVDTRMETACFPPRFNLSPHPGLYALHWTDQITTFTGQYFLQALRRASGGGIAAAIGMLDDEEDEPELQPSATAAAASLASAAPYPPAAAMQPDVEIIDCCDSDDGATAPALPQPTRPHVPLPRGAGPARVESLLGRTGDLLQAAGPAANRSTLGGARLARPDSLEGRSGEVLRRAPEQHQPWQQVC